MKTRSLAATPSLALHVAFLIVLHGLIAVSFLMNLPGTPNGQPYAMVLAELLVVVSIAWALVSWRLRTGGLFDLYGLFLAVVGLTHGAIPLLHLLGQSPIYGMYTARWLSSLSAADQIKAYFLIAASVGWLHLGALLAPAHCKTIGPSIHRQLQTMGRRVGLLVLAVAFVPFLITIERILANWLVSGYRAYFLTYKQLGISNWAMQGATFFLVGALFLFACTEPKHRTTRIIAALSIVGYAFCYFVIGSRNKAFLPAIAFLWLNHKTRWIRLPSFVLVLLAVLAIVSAPVLVQWRANPGLDIRTAWPGYQTAGRLTEGALAQLGIYSEIVTSAVARFPTIEPFIHGRSYLNTVFYLVPNLGGAPQHFGLDVTTVNWVARSYFPELMSRSQGFGTGFSFIAEAFESFGSVGTQLVMLLVGLVVGRLAWLGERSDDPVVRGLVAAIMVFLLFYPRDSFYALARGVVWYCLPLALAIYLARHLLTSAGFSTRSFVAPPANPTGVLSDHG